MIPSSQGPAASSKPTGKRWGEAGTEKSRWEQAQPLQNQINPSANWASSCWVNWVSFISNLSSSSTGEEQESGVRLAQGTIFKFCKTLVWAGPAVMA